MSAWIALIIDITLAIIFLEAFYNKVIRFSILKYQSFFMRTSTLFVLIIEFALIIMFGADLYSPYKEWAALLLFIVFSVYLIKKNQGIRIQTCTCFGDHSWLNKLPLIRNSVLAVLTVTKLSIQQNHTELLFRLTILFFILNVLILVRLFVKKIKMKEQINCYDNNINHIIH